MCFKDKNESTTYPNEYYAFSMLSFICHLFKYILIFKSILLYTFKLPNCQIHIHSKANFDKGKLSHDDDEETSKSKAKGINFDGDQIQPMVINTYKEHHFFMEAIGEWLHIK